MIEESNDIAFPNEWKWATINEMIGDIGFFNDGDWVETKDQDPKGDVRLIQLADIGNGSYKNKSKRYLTYQKSIELKCKFLECGDILVARMPEPLGRACIFPGDEKQCITVVDICIIRVDIHRVHNKWLMYALNSPQIREAIQEMQSGTTRQRISRSNLARIKFPYPPINDQQYLASKLDSIFSQICITRAALEYIPSLLKAFRQSVLASAFRGELTERDPNDEPAEVLLERIRAERRRKREEVLRTKKGKAPAKSIHEEQPMPDTSILPKLPEGWIWVRVSDIAEVHLGRQRSPARAIGPNMCTYIRAANITWNGLELSDVMQMDFTPEEQKVYDLRIGDVLLNEASGSVAEVGKPAIWRGEIPGCCFQNTLIRVRSEGPLSEYLYFHFYYDALTVRFSQSTQGIGINHLGAKGLSEWVIALPPIEEQKRIVDKLKNCFENIVAVRNANKAASCRLDELEQAALSKAFRGELV
jgi:type I restriction enzyme, S subunit